MHAFPTGSTRSDDRLVAVIDVGSNSIKLLVGRTGTGGAAEAVFSETIETRISSGIGKAVPRLGAAGMQAGLEAIRELMRMAGKYEPAAVRIVATSAVRDAVNRKEFAEAVGEATGIPLEILSGEAEANGVGRGLLCDPALRGAVNLLQVDIGGGSLELIRFHEGAIRQALSLPLGAVRLTEELLPQADEPVNGENQDRVRRHVERKLAASGFPFAPPCPLAATGGAFVAARAILAAAAGLDIEAYGAVLHTSELSRLREQLCALPSRERMAVPNLPAARADILPAALIAMEAVCDRAGAETLTHSFHNLRYGIAAEMLEA